MQPQFFKTSKDFCQWLAENHESETELLVGFYKVGTGKPSMSWPESVNEALCFGWIDGIRRRIDDDRYSIRFTPRKPTSIWSSVNIKKMEVLEKAGLLKPAGIAAFAKRKIEKSSIYAYENERSKWSAEFEKRFLQNTKAWQFFHSQAPSYQKTAVHFVMSAKQEKTRHNRFEALLCDSENGLRIKQLRR